MLSSFSIFHQFSNSIKLAMFTKENLDERYTDSYAQEQLNANGIAGAWQVHGGDCIIARESEARTRQADAVATDVPGLALSVIWADCQNFIVYAPKQHVTGVIHAGWKGLKANVIGNFFTMIQDEWGIEGKDTYVAAGPSLCTACSEFTNPEEELNEFSTDFFHGRNVDLQGIANMQLLHAGVVQENIDRHPDCTCCKPESYFTYRGGDRELVQDRYRNALACVLL